MRSLEGKGVNEKGYTADGKCIVAVDPIYFRPTEVGNLLGDSTKARNNLGWYPKINFDEMVREMTEADYAECKAAMSNKQIK